VAAHFEGKSHVLRNAHVRIEGIILENHGHISVLGRFLIHHAIAYEDLAAADFLQPGNHAQDRGFTTTRGTNQHDELVIVDLQIDAVDNLHTAVFLDDFLQFDICH